jgi:transcriptional regulator GlxA family with amidase domain
MLSIGILIFDDVEILDFSGPYEVFSTAARVHRRTVPSDTLFGCSLIADALRPVRTRGGMLVLPDHALASTPDIDVLIVPGGDVSAVLGKTDVIEWIRTRHAHSTITASVCTGAFLLAKADVLDGLAATTHWEDQADLQAAFPALNVVKDAPWVDCGKVVSSGGISAGIDMSLHLVERLAGRELALATARQMEYRWNEHGSERDSHTAHTANTGVLSAA